MLSFLRPSRGSAGYEEIRYSCTVNFLDEMEPMTVSYQKSSKGQDLMDQVCVALNLIERDYFGLRYMDLDKQTHWLDAAKNAGSQLKNLKPAMLYFRVKFYPSDPMRLKEELTRYYLYVQLMRDLHNGRLLCTTSEANQLAAYRVQAELGDFESYDSSTDYVSQVTLLPKQCQNQHIEIAEFHRQLSGLGASEMETCILEMASKLDTYGVDPHPVRVRERSISQYFYHPVKDSTGVLKYLGVTNHGIVTFQENRRTNLFKWSQVKKLDIDGKRVVISVKEESPGSSAGGVVVVHIFKCSSSKESKNLWRCCVEQQLFYTLPSSVDAPKVAAGRGLFRRGSKYRFRSASNPQITRAPSSISSSATRPVWFTTATSGLDKSHSLDNVAALRSMACNWSNDSSVEDLSLLRGDSAGLLKAFPEDREEDDEEDEYTDASVNIEPTSSQTSDKRFDGGGGDATTLTNLKVANGGTSRKVRSSHLVSTTANLDEQITELRTELRKSAKSQNTPVTSQINNSYVPVNSEVNLSDHLPTREVNFPSNGRPWNGVEEDTVLESTTSDRRSKISRWSSFCCYFLRLLLRLVLFLMLMVLISVPMLLIIVHETGMHVPIISDLHASEGVENLFVVYYELAKKHVLDLIE